MSLLLISLQITGLESGVPIAQSRPYHELCFGGRTAIRFGLHRRDDWTIRQSGMERGSSFDFYRREF